MRLGGPPRSCRRRRLGPRLGLIILIAAWLLGRPDAVVAQGREVHGENSVFAGPGVVVAWGILKKPVEDESEVVIRIVVTDPAYSHLVAEAMDPFSRTRRRLGPDARVGLALSATVEIRERRGAFANYPRLEIHLYQLATPAALTVYYLGVPDTTPEFVSEALLRAYLDDAVARARTPGSRTP